MTAVKRKYPHPHADLIRQYAEDEIKYERAHILWEFKELTDERWHDLPARPFFKPEYQFRRKPETITVTFEMPIPELGGNAIKKRTKLFSPFGHFYFLDLGVELESINKRLIFNKESDMDLFLANYKNAVDKALEEL